MQSVTSILLVTKTRHAAAESTAVSVARWLEARGVASSTVSAAHPARELADRARAADVVLILGGDGTFVGVGRKLAGIDVRFSASTSGRSAF